MSSEHVRPATPDPALWRPFWERFLATRPDLGAQEPADVFAFGDHRALADELAELVRRGVKRGTCTSQVALRQGLATSPRPGDLSVVLKGDGTPVCVIETIATFTSRFIDVDAGFAAEEGEGDGSLAYWRDAHETFFGREGERLGYTFTPQLEVECERFRVVWPEPA